MPNRYITDKEKEGTIRRMQAYRKRLQESGIRARAFNLTDAEDARLRQIVDVWRGNKTDLTKAQVTAALNLKVEE